MPTRAPVKSLQAQLKPAYRRVRLALVARHASRAAAVAIALVALGLLAGTLLPVSPATAWTRLTLVVLGSASALFLATRAFLREAPGWDTWLEAVERRFPEVRSLLRNALDFEHHGDAHTSDELASAVAPKPRSGWPRRRSRNSRPHSLLAARCSAAARVP